jgi:hypothetical protein
MMSPVFAKFISAPFQWVKSPAGDLAPAESKPSSRASRFWCCQTRLRSPVYRRQSDLPLPELVKEVILTSKLPARWRISVESPAQRGTGVTQGYSE